MGDGMARKMLLSFMFCLLIPTCIAVYVLLFQQLKSKGFFFADKHELAVTVESEEIAAGDVVTIEDAPTAVEEADATDPSETEEADASDEESEAKVEAPIAPNERIERLTYEQLSDGVRVRIVTRDEDRNVLKERIETIKYDDIIQEKSDRYLEIIAEEFVRLHFKETAFDVFYEGELVKKDNEFARVAVEKIDWKGNFYRETFDVVIDLNGGKPKPISMQVATM